MGTLGKLLCLPFKLLAWLLTFPIRQALAPLKLVCILLLVVLVLAAVPIVLFHEFFIELFTD